MDEIPFKKEFREGLYNYTNVMEPHFNASNLQGGNKDVINDYRFDQYLSLAEFLMEDLHKFVLLKKTSDFLTAGTLDFLFETNYEYQVISDDYYGIGVDHGFIQPSTYQNNNAVYAIKSLLQLKDFYEDNFGDSVSHICVFGLKQYTIEALREALSGAVNHSPLTALLLPGDIFINIISSKQIGYFHSILIKAVEDIEIRIDGFKHVLAPFN